MNQNLLYAIILGGLIFAVASAGITVLARRYRRRHEHSFYLHEDLTPKIKQLMREHDNAVGHDQEMEAHCRLWAEINRHYPCTIEGSWVLQSSDHTKFIRVVKRG